jgi:hypothetical protein
VHCRHIESGHMLLREILVQVRHQSKRYGKLVTKVTKERVYSDCVSI